MRTPEMSDGNNFRSKTRTPNIFQNIERPLPSPISTSMKLNDTEPLSPNQSPNTKSMVSQKLQTLKQRKFDLDKLLIEKNTLLQQLCREEAKLIGCSTFSLNELSCNIGGIDCNDGGDRSKTPNNNNNNSTLRRHIDTGFKLPENLLNSNEDDINQLMLSKKIQQQISQASMKMANDVAQTKSIRRAHKQNYDVAQQKIQNINQNLRMLKSCASIESNIVHDDMNVNNNIGMSTMCHMSLSSNSKNSNNSPNSNIQLKSNLNTSNSSIEPISNVSERRNSAVSTGSAQYLATSNPTKMRSRCDSYSGQSSGIQPFTSNTNKNCNEKILHSPSYYQQQFPHLHYKSHADKVVYVTNAVANAAPANNNNININSHSPNGNAMILSPKYGRLRKPLTVDTSINESYYYPAPNSNGNHQHRASLQQFYTQQQQHFHRHSPYSITRTHSIPSKSKIPSSHSPQINPKHISDDEDDIAGQYATLLTLSEPTKPLKPSESENQDIDTHYTEILYRHPQSTERNQSQSKDVTEQTTKNQGLGGYWITNENNERVWYSLDNRYSSLDRKSQKNKMKKQMLRHTNQPIKSTSLGSFNFINKADDLESNAANEHRRSKEKQWIETSLDAAPVQKIESISPQLVSPTISYRERSRLSSHSMHSSTLSTTENISINQQPISPPYYHDTMQTFDNNNVIDIAQISRQSPDVPSTSNSFNLDNSNNNFSPNVSSASEIHVESPQNVTIVQQAKFQPYKEVTKPFEMSDFYKYSTKYRQKATTMQQEHNSPKLPPKNSIHQLKNPNRHIHPMNVNAAAEQITPTYSINQ